jgi:hypothetical protein
MTLAQALDLPADDSDVRGALVREAIAAILNAAHESLEYPYSRFQIGIDGRPPIVPTVAELLRNGSSADIVKFTRLLAHANSLGCPLD